DHSDVTLTNPTAGQVLTFDGATWINDDVAAGGTLSLNLILDGGGAAITTGSKGYVWFDFACEIQQATVLADQTGDLVVDLKTSDYATFPTTASICGAAKPTLSAAQKSQDATLT